MCGVIWDHRGVTSPTGGLLCAWLPCSRTATFLSFRVFCVLTFGSYWLLWVLLCFFGGVIAYNVLSIYDVATIGNNVPKGERSRSQIRSVK